MMGAVKRGFVVGTIVTAVTLAAGRAPAADVTDADRTYRNFTRETATVGEGQVRVEVRGMHYQDQNDLRLNLAGLRVRKVYPGTTVADLKDADLTGGVIELVTSYGIAKNMEAGFIIPGYISSISLGNGRDFNDQDIGDFLMYGKFQHPVAEHCAIGAGLELTMPNGPEHKGFGRGELGTIPMISTRYQKGPWAVGGTMAYEIYGGNAADVFMYGAQVIVRGGPTYAIRTEIVGRVFHEGGNRNHDLTIYPGIDYKLSDYLTVRPTGMANGTDTALDWGIGLGLAGTF